MNIQAHEQIQVVSVIDPENQTASTVTGDWADVKDFQRFLAIFSVGVMESTGTVDFSVVEATDSSGTSAQILQAATQLTEAGSDDDKQVVISLRPEDVSDGFTHIAVRCTTATDASDVHAVLLGIDPVYGYDATKDLASVDEIIAV